MTDLGITKLCADARGYAVQTIQGSPASKDSPCPDFSKGLRVWSEEKGVFSFAPLHDDAQNAQLEWWLIERGKLVFDWRAGFMWFTPRSVKESGAGQEIEFLNIVSKRRAICLCVAKIQANK